MRDNDLPIIFSEWLQRHAAHHVSGADYEVVQEYLEAGEPDSVKVSTTHTTLAEVCRLTRPMIAGVSASLRVTYRGVPLAYASSGNKLAWALPDELRNMVIRHETITNIRKIVRK